MVYVLVERQFADYPWCQRTLRGIYEEGRKKRISVREICAIAEAHPGRNCILLVGASAFWIDTVTQKARNAGLYPIALSNRQSGSSGHSVSSVMMDIHSSMQLAVDYLHSLGRKNLALFGVNPSASSDPWRARRFQELTGRAEHIFQLQPTMEDAFNRFYEAIGQYDGVICASDYAAVSLVRRLRERSFPVPEKLYIVGYGDMFLSRLSSPSITSISDDYENFGRAALSICSLVEKNETVSVINILLNSRLHIRQTTENRPYIPTNQPTAEPQLPENQFFRDPEIAGLARLETLFNQCDETDFSLLQLLLQEASYASLAKQCFISESAAKYRVKKMQKLCGVNSREELVRYIGKIL